MIEVKVTTVGSSAGIVLPKEALNKLSIKKGDRLFLVESPNGYLLTAYDPALEEQLNHTEEIANKYRNALRELAK
jgi:putative addiction module antidote